MHSGTFSCLLLALAFPFCAISQNTATSSVTNLPKNIPYSDENTGVVFPSKIGPFSKTTVRKNNNPLYGTLIRYSGSFGTSADIYIYSLTAVPGEVSMKNAEEHYEQVKNNILMLSSKSSALEQITLEEEYNLQADQRDAGKRAVFLFQMDGENFNSELVILPYGDRIVKLRITSPSESSAARKAVGEFLQTICDSFFKGRTVRFIQQPRPKTVQ